MKDDDMNECLWQVIEKRHMEFNAKETISVEEWNRFCLHLQDAFADEISLLALEFWRERRMYGVAACVGEEE